MIKKQHDALPRLSEKELIILEMLICNGEKFGLQLVEESGGRLGKGTIYVSLNRLTKKGYVESREEPREHPEIGIPRRKYWVTGLGQMVYKANTVALEFLNSEMVLEGAV
jgi:PadR family transcriptional regulator, regulatory protein PadR